MAGGQATNSGIDYQQRVAAWCLINQFTDFDISIYFDQLDEELIIQKVLFETDKPIDDLNLECSNGKNILLQIKRSISLSTREESDFWKTIFQFSSVFIKSPTAENYFGLITTSDASGKIAYDLKKICVSVRLNENAFSDNPLNESEKDSLEKVKEVFFSVYEKLVGKKTDEKTFIKFLKQIFIGVIDIETGRSNEIASLMLLRSIGFKNPDLIWSVLIKNCLHYASERLSIDKPKLKEVLDRYLEKESKKDGKEEDVAEILKTEIITMGDFPVGKEVLLIESFYEKLDYMIVELYRFTDDCRIKNIFHDNKIQIKSGDEWTVVQRFATMAGLDRFLKETEGRFKDKKVAILPAKDIDEVESDKCSQLHKTLLEKLVKENKNPLSCLHCGKGINTNESLIIEVEDKDTQAAVGLIHKPCVRPIDRILGIPKGNREETKEHLRNFDFKLWVSLLMKGQGMLNALKSSPELAQGRTPIIAWNSDEEYDTDYSYCIKFILEDGSSSYSYQRSRIERLNKLQAEEHLKLFNSVQKKQVEKNDPWCVLSMSKAAAPYSEILKLKKTDDVILEIKCAEIAKYSKLIAKAFDKDLFHYAPLCIARDVDSETFINLSNVVPIISDPLTFDNLLSNWKTIGFKIDSPVELKIIKSDKDFDNYMRIIFADGMVPILDPIFDKNFKLVNGFPIQEFNSMIAKMEQSKSKDTAE
ncbi:MAG: hypothetical protein ABI851_15370 [Saprospiraceae bacterium]